MFQNHYQIRERERKRVTRFRHQLPNVICIYLESMLVPTCDVIPLRRISNSIFVNDHEFASPILFFPANFFWVSKDESGSDTISDL